MFPVWIEINHLEVIQLSLSQRGLFNYLCEDSDEIRWLKFNGNFTNWITDVQSNERYAYALQIKKFVLLSNDIIFKDASSNVL